MGSIDPKGYLNVPTVYKDEQYHRRLIAEAVNRLLSGKLNNVSTSKLTQDAVSTSVSDLRCSPNSAILVMPTSTNAGVALTTWNLSTIDTGSFTIEHVSTSTSDCTFTYAIFG